MIKHFCDICQNEASADDYLKTQEAAKEKFTPAVAGSDCLCTRCRPFHEEYWTQKAEVLTEQLNVLQQRLKNFRNQFFRNVVLARIKEKSA